MTFLAPDQQASAIERHAVAHAPSGQDPVLPTVGDCKYFWAPSAAEAEVRCPGWQVLDGAVTMPDGTVPPDMRDRFIVGAGTTYAIGDTGGAAASGALTHTGTAVDAHTGTAVSAHAGTAVTSHGTHTHSISTSGAFSVAGVDVAHRNSVTDASVALTHSVTQPNAHTVTQPDNHTVTQPSSHGTVATLPPYGAFFMLIYVGF